MLEIRNIQKSFGSLEVLKGIDLTVEKGDVVAIIGPAPLYELPGECRERHNGL